MKKPQIMTKKGEKGQSLVELAVSVLILILLLAGIIDLGRILFYYITMRDAAQEAAVYGAINPTKEYCPLIVERAKNAMGDRNVLVYIRIADDLTGCADANQTTQACSGQQIKVSVEKPDFPLTMPLIGAIIGSQTISLKAEISGTILRPACGP